MNEKLQAFARKELKNGLSKCNERQQHLFKRMYSHNNLQLSINEIIDNMEENKLDRVMQQVQNTLKKNEINK